MSTGGSSSRLSRHGLPSYDDCDMPELQCACGELVVREIYYTEDYTHAACRRVAVYRSGRTSSTSMLNNSIQDALASAVLLLMVLMWLLWLIPSTLISLTCIVCCSFSIPGPPTLCKRRFPIIWHSITRSSTMIWVWVTVKGFWRFISRQDISLFTRENIY